MATVIVKGRQVRLTPAMVIGKGGEADIYNLGNGTVLKLFKRADDPDYQGNPDAQQGATLRLQEHQQKLPAFPSQLPAAVTSPEALAYNKAKQKVVGYTMPYLEKMVVLLSYGDRQYREQGGIDGNQVVTIFRNLHEVVRQIHAQNVVIGDFNDLNIMVAPDGSVQLIDADSMQFGPFRCHTFTARFVDPLCCASDALTLNSPHNEDSDWYAFTTMLFQSLLFVGPYGGVHKPKAGKRLQHDKRVLQRVTIFDSEVVYPKPAVPLAVLPDELLEYFRNVYERNQRGVFPIKLLQSLRWTTCKNCGTEHARPICPDCAAPGVARQTMVTRGAVTARRVFYTQGQLLETAFQHGTLRFLYHEGEAFKRENGHVVVKAPLDPELRFRLQGANTLIGKQQRLLVFTADGNVTQLNTTTAGKLPVFDTNEDHRFWVEDEQLVRDDRLGNQFLGTILPGHTLIWTGNRFGFGLYQAGSLVRSFVFDTQGNSLNDRVPITNLPGQLIDASCVFSDRLAWFMVRLQENGRIANRCFVIDSNGQLIAEAEGDDDSSWLAQGIRGHMAVGQALFAATDTGIVKLEVGNGMVQVAQTFPDTEPFVDAHSKLLPAAGGIHVVSSKEITLLKLR